MTNYLQAKYEALVLNDIPLPTAVKVNKYVTNHPDEFTRKELDDVTVVFKSLETGLRQGTIFPRDLHRALTRLGLNPTDQEIVDIANYIAKYEVQTSLPHCHTFTILRDGLIYFPDFCHFVLGKLREEERDRGEDFRQNMFKVAPSSSLISRDSLVN